MLENAIFFAFYRERYFTAAVQALRPKLDMVLKDKLHYKVFNIKLAIILLCLQEQYYFVIAC